MKDAAVTGLLTSYRTTSDGGLRLTVELDELQASIFHDAFPSINLFVAVARINEQVEGTG
jgi:hypothetical protein